MGVGGQIQIISEFEVVVVYILKVIQFNYLKVGDNFIVCDGGGGMVE